MGFGLALVDLRSPKPRHDASHAREHDAQSESTDRDPQRRSVERGLT